ncbi:MAG TPA: RICIN domain-containing protein, partial [Gammaproteobacteria bacterium]
ESRSQISGLCAFPTAIEAQTTVMDMVFIAYGPNDRLAQLTPYGLVCNNADQPNGQCSNYVVRYSECTDAPEAYEAKIRSVWSWNLLTAADNQNDAETRAQPQNASWTSQDWVIEPVAGSANVRIKNVWTGRYLNVQNNGENAKIVTYDLVPEWTSQQWIIEPVSGGSDVRLRNAWSGKYLTVVDSGNYAAILSQSLNTGWASQRWRIEE